MAYEKRDNSGSAFKNRKKQSDSHSDYQGDGLIDGQEYWINVWVKKDKNGNPWFSYSFRKKQAKQDMPSRQSEQSKREIDIDDSNIPF